MADIKMGQYKHFKGGSYEALFIAKHSETLEEMMVYKNLQTGVIWVRPLCMWEEEVTVNGNTVRRFTLVE